ncbi:uncharacterized protein LOC134527926 [Bacillus rossius redtenbacheri]|uniref:uncharacterized protein LOC134527926 n=1 Tax=Bacillus rossius redtenbacheri TaxID=93214 RepID=UPI002FDE9787
MRPDVSPDKLLRYYQQGDWQRVVGLLSGDDGEGDSFYDESYLWVKPTLQALMFVKEQTESSGASRLISIGSGTCLLEWLIHSATGLEVLCLEVNKAWWTSGYAVQTFLPHQYADELDAGQLCDKHSALLFCYFNDGRAFQQYVTAHRGRCLLVIGPGEGRGTHTCPEPFDPPLDRDEWTMVASQELGNTKDFVAVYTR